MIGKWNCEAAAMAAEAGEKRAVLQRVLLSTHFARSPKLVRFLQYVCEQEMAGKADDICEQVVGSKVFDRPAGYNSNDDNIVRSHAIRLRQRLENYFENEGRAEPFRIVVPRGSYVPEFIPQGNERVLAEQVHSESVELIEVSGQAAATPLPDAAGVPPPIRTRRWRILVVGVFVLCALSPTATWLVMKRIERQAALAEEQPNHALWATLYQKTQRTLIVPGDSSLVLYNNMVGKTEGLSDYVKGSYRTDPEPQRVTSRDELKAIANRRLTSIIDVKIVGRMLRRPESGGSLGSVVYSRDLQMDDLKQANVILIGSQEANAWVQLFERDLNFTLVPDQRTSTFTVVNRLPRSGEQPTYTSELTSPKHTGYALISFLSNLGRNGNILIVQGSGMAATEAAAEFVLGPSELGKLLQESGLHGVPMAHFEVLLQTSNVSGDASGWKVVASRLYP